MKPKLRISFHFALVKDDSRLNDGVMNDMVHIRYLVSFLNKATLKTIKLCDLPEDFQYFFSRIFTESEEKNRSLSL
jgi:hypothetical protein